jgi:hypothetical protein
MRPVLSGLSRRSVSVSAPLQHQLDRHIFSVAGSGDAGATFVNGFCFPAKALVHGDRIRIGRSIFVYVEIDEIDEVDPAMLKLTPAEEQWDRVGATQRVGAYEAARTTVLEAFLQIAASINGIRDAAEIQSRVLELIFQVISVERAAILLVGHDQDRTISGTYRRIGSQIDGGQESLAIGDRSQVV